MSFRLLELAPGVEAPAIARRALRAWLTGDGLADLEEAVLLVGSELVTNAAVHAATAIELSYRTDREVLEIGVGDQDPCSRRLVPAPRDARLREPDPTGLVVGGRGLLIVSVIADQWGVTATESGKRVWATWRLAP